MRAHIYQITNKANGKTYVGLTQWTVKQRWAQHIQNARRGLKTYLYSAIKKHGVERFEVENIATCIEAADAWLVEREIIADRKPAYNMTNGGEFTVGKRVAPEVVARIKAANTGQKRSAETRALQSQRKKERIAADPVYRAKMLAALERGRANRDVDKQRAAASLAARNRVWTAESRAKLSDSHMGIRHTPEVLARISAKKCKPVECTTLATVFDSLSEAAEFTSVGISNISRVCRSGSGTAGALEFRFCQGNQ